MKTIKVFLKKKIYKKREYARNQYGKLFKENKFSEEEKNKKLQYARDICNNLSKREKCRNLSEEENDKKRQYARDCYRKIFRSFNFFWNYKKLFSFKSQVFSGKHEISFQGLEKYDKFFGAQRYKKLF